MLSQEDAEALGRRLAELQCTDPDVGDGLFRYVFQKEPPDKAARYESHVRVCEHCRVALEVYRYKRDIAQLLGSAAENDNRPLVDRQVEGITTIYLSLPDENVNVRRPVQAEHIAGNVYLILQQPYDRGVERWEFEPGNRVVCEPVETSDGRVLAAVRLAG